MLGMALRPTPFGTAIFWPASGMLTVLACTVAPRYWWLLAIGAVSGEIAGAYMGLDRAPTPQATIYFAFCHVAEAFAIALLRRRFTTAQTRADVVRTLRTISYVLAGTAGSALLAAPMLAALTTQTTLLDNTLSWWLSDFLGILLVAPILVGLLPRGHLARRTASAGSAEILALCLAAAVATSLVFAWDPAESRHILELPTLIVVVVIWAALRAGPVAIAWVCVICAVVAATLPNFGVGSMTFSGEQALNDLVEVQIFFAVLFASAFLLSSLSEERRIAWKLAIRNNDRYRAFVQQSSEAVWRVDLREPMPTTLDSAAQAEWIKQHGIVAEHNDAYARTLQPETSSLIGVPWRRHVVWSEAVMLNIEQAIENQYRLNDIELNVDGPDGEAISWRANIVGHVENGCLTHLWGIAQDITALKHHEMMSAMSRARVRSLVERLEAFEEHTRKSFASELHDGPAQTLAGVDMLLASLRSSLPASKRDVLAQAQDAVGEAIGELRTLMTEYWPRSLKGEDFLQALRQLVDQYRDKEDMTVNFAVVGRLDDLPEIYANVIYNALRELLRNVLKHAEGRCTAVLFRTDETIELRVRDYGKARAAEAPSYDFSHGFGLQSLTQRVTALDGKLDVRARRNGGTLVRILIPLARQKLHALSA